MNWLFTSPYVTDREEVLVYREDDLFAWLGGAIGLFVGYSMYDLSSHIIDLAFNLISRLTNANIQNPTWTTSVCMSICGKCYVLFSLELQ